MNHFVIRHRARQWFTQCSTGQSGTQWTRTPPGSLAPSDYWRMLEIWSQTNWNILRGWTEQLSAPPETWKHSEIQGQKTSSLRTKWLHLQIQIYNRKTQTKENAVITWAQSLEYSINMINTPAVVLKETKKKSNLKEYVNCDWQSLYWGAESGESNSFCKHRVIREANVSAALSILKPVLGTEGDFI